MVSGLDTLGRGQRLAGRPHRPSRSALSGGRRWLGPQTDASLTGCWAAIWKRGQDDVNRHQLHAGAMGPRASS